MEKVLTSILALLLSHVINASTIGAHFGNEPGPRPVPNIGMDHHFRVGFGINNFGMDYTFGVRFFDRFSIGAGVGLKTLRAPIFTSLSVQQQPKINLLSFPVYLLSEVSIWNNGNLNVYGYGMFGRSFYTSNENTTSDKGVPSFYAELGAGVRWKRERNSVGIGLGQFYTNTKGTARIDYLDSDAFVDYDVEIYNLTFNITLTRFL